MTATPTSYFTGGKEEGYDYGPARKVAFDLSRAHDGLSFDIAFSAAAFLVRDGQQLNDSRVLAEARRRQARLNRVKA